MKPISDDSYLSATPAKKVAQRNYGANLVITKGTIEKVKPSINESLSCGRTSYKDEFQDDKLLLTIHELDINRKKIRKETIWFLNWSLSTKEASA